MQTSTQLNVNTWTPQPAEWQHQYDQTGFVCIPNVLDAALLATLQQEMERIEADYHAEKLPPSLMSLIQTEHARSAGQKLGGSSSDAISVIMELPLFGRAFSELILYPPVLDILEALFESSEFSFHNYKAICKMPGNAAPFRWHRDLPYLHHTSPNLLTCMLCLDDMTVENGATAVCPGSHLKAPMPALLEDCDIAESDVPAERMTVVCPAGSAVLFHVNVVHGGGPNLSHSKRRNIISIWAGPENYPTTPERYAFEFLMPRSHDPLRRRQVELTFETH